MIITDSIAPNRNHRYRGTVLIQCSTLDGDVPSLFSARADHARKRLATSRRRFPMRAVTDLLGAMSQRYNLRVLDVLVKPRSTQRKADNHGVLRSGDSVSPELASWSSPPRKTLTVIRLKSMTRIAESTLDAFYEGLEPRSLHIAISIPEIDPKDSRGSTYRTLLEFGDFYEPKFVHGADSLQSLRLALNMLRRMLEILADDGWVLYYPGSDEVVPAHLNMFGLGCES